MPIAPIPEALREKLRRNKPAPAEHPVGEVKPATTPPPEQRPVPKKRRNVAQRLDEMYDRDARGPKDDPTTSGRARRRRQQAPSRPGGPSV